MSQSNPVSEVLSEVSEALKGSPDTVRCRLKSALVERELAKRVELLDKALSKLGEQRKDILKMKPDVETFSEDGVKLPGTFSKAKFEEKKKAAEAMDKLQKAVEAALLGESPDAFAKLGELIK